MGKKRTEFLKVISNHPIFVFLVVICSLVLFSGKGTAQFFPLPFGGPPVFGVAPPFGVGIGGFAPLGIGAGGFAPMLGFPSFPVMSDPFALAVGPAYPASGFGWQQPLVQPTLMQPSGMFGATAPIQGPSSPSIQPPFGSPYGSYGATMPAGSYGVAMPPTGQYALPTNMPNYGASPYVAQSYGAYAPQTYAPQYSTASYPQYGTAPSGGALMPTMPASYGQPLPSYGQPFGITVPTSAPAGYLPASMMPTTPAGLYTLDPRYAQGYNPYQQPSTPYQQPTSNTYTPYYGGTSYPTTNSQTSGGSSGSTSSYSQQQTSSSGSGSSIQDLPNLSALWQGSYTIYDPNSTTLKVLSEGFVTLGLTQKKNDYQISGYMTVTGWEIVNENQRGRVLATVNYADSARIDFINVIVRFYPELKNDEEPKSDSIQYIWVFSGSISNNTLQGSLNISGPNGYSKAGTINLAKKQI